MPEGSPPSWRAGAAASALAVAGLWIYHPRSASTWEAVAERGAPPEPGQPISLRHPMVVLAGALDAYDEPVGARPRRLRKVMSPEVLLPIGEYPIRPGVRVEAGEGAVLSSSPFAELVRILLGNPAEAEFFAASLAGALEVQHWALRLSAEGAPLARLVALLARIAEDAGEAGPGGIEVRGAPDVRELSVLAGVSRESAVINLAWLAHRGIIARGGGRLRVPDLERLRAAGTEEGV